MMQKREALPASSFARRNRFSNLLRWSEVLQEGLVPGLRHRELRDQRSRLPHKGITALLLRLGMPVVKLRIDQNSLEVRVQKQIRIQRAAQHKGMGHLPVT